MDPLSADKSLELYQTELFHIFIGTKYQRTCSEDKTGGIRNAEEAKAQELGNHCFALYSRYTLHRTGESYSSTSTKVTHFRYSG